MRAARGDRARGALAFAARSLASPSPPAWVFDWIGDPPVRPAPSRDGVSLEVRDGAACAFARARVAGARGLDGRGLELAAERAYHALAALLAERELVPLRMWNYVPGIRARAPGDLSRYEAFNLGRHRAVSEWLAAPRLAGRLPAASAVDHHGADLEVHVLAGAEPGVAIENPRQVPAYRYSGKYGPRPPSFARAVRVGAHALISGTASIVGEDSRHEGDLEAQLDETFANLEALASALGLRRHRALRVYVVRAADARRVARRVRRDLAHDALELFRADLCRPELLVEIEALADAAP